MILKAITWRLVSFIATLLAAWFVTGSLPLGTTIALVTVIPKLILYYGHEKYWDKWGKKLLYGLLDKLDS